MQYLRILILMSFSWFALIAQAAVEVQTVEVSAMAASEEKAITKALARAVEQVNGVQVEVKTVLKETEERIYIDWLGNKTVLESADINKGAVNTQAVGPVRSYKVIDSTYLKDEKLWKVTISAKVSKFQQTDDGREKLVKFVVSPFRAERTTFASVDGAYPAHKVSHQISKFISDHVVKSGRFRVLDRTFWQEMTKENMVIRTFSTSTDEAVKLGQTLGADYILTGFIEDFDVKHLVDDAYGAQLPYYEAEFTVDARIIEVATSDTIWSERFTKRYDRKQMQAMLKELRPDPFTKSEADAALELQENLYADMALMISQQVIQYFYPIKVLSLEGRDAIYLNQGDEVISVGQQYDIFSHHKKVQDPDTGVEISIDGKSVATVEVTAVEDGYAIAKMVNGSFDKITEGAVARLLLPVVAEENTEPVEVKPLTPGSSEQPLQWK